MRRWGAFAAVVVLLVAGCGQHHRAPVQFRIAASSAMFDSPLGFTLSGVPKGGRVMISATTADRDGTEWRSSATYLPDRSGVVDPAAAAPVSGDYTGAHDTGLLWSMVGPTGNYFNPPAHAMTVRLTASVDGRRVAETELIRQMDGAGVIERKTTVVDDGFAGGFFTPRDTTARRPAVLVFGGSEGGTGSGTFEARALAAKGYPALGLGYFKATGLPGALDRIPLEYFVTAIRWLAVQPGVDQRRIYLDGASRGSEAALLLGACFPDLVFGVIAGSPSSVVNPGYPDTSQPAWTLRGRPIAHVSISEYGLPQPAGNPAAVIPVERIRGPVLLLCGDADSLWPSCPYADAVAARLGAHPHVLLSEPGAGHYVADVVPDLPGGLSAAAGGTRQADALGRLDAWPKLLSLLTTSAFR